MTTDLAKLGFTSTAHDALEGVDLTGQRILVTGASSGIGAETVRALHQAGADVVLAVRDPSRIQDVVDALSVIRSPGSFHIERLDLADLRSILDFVSRWTGPLNVLVNNAGVMAFPALERNADDMEAQFAINYFGHFALTLGLLPALTQAGRARVVCLSSSAHQFSPVILQDPDFKFRPYDPILAYGQSKTACSLLAVEVTRRWGRERGIFANAVHPGAIATALQRHTGGLRTPAHRRKTVEQGAATSVLLAASPLLKEVGGRYFEDCQEAMVVASRTDDLTGVAHYALDPLNARELWDHSRARLHRLNVLDRFTRDL